MLFLVIAKTGKTVTHESTGDSLSESGCTMHISIRENHLFLHFIQVSLCKSVQSLVYVILVPICAFVL